MTATPAPSRPTPRAPARARSGPVLAALSGLLALWLGLAAPVVSPVAGPLVPAAVSVQLPAPAAGAVPAAPAAAPVR